MDIPDLTHMDDTASDGALDVSLGAIEGQLAGLRPARLSEGLLDRLEAGLNRAAVVDQVDAPEAQVIEFPQRQRRAWSSWWGAAAAVALGGAAALWLPQRESPAVAATRAHPASSAPVASAAGKVVAAGYGRDVREASDEGIVLQGQVPHRRVRVVYMDRVVVTNAQGEKIEVERPRVEWLLIPEKMD